MPFSEKTAISLFVGFSLLRVGQTDDEYFYRMRDEPFGSQVFSAHFIRSVDSMLKLSDVFVR